MRDKIHANSEVEAHKNISKAFLVCISVVVAAAAAAAAAAVVDDGFFFFASFPFVLCFISWHRLFRFSFR